ncbi:MAG TPA: hypothetical protein VGS61_03470, partial [Acidimicrobiales bacterium]|nr:hypothetical protein [Acidimicrobiales bacterium]
MTRPLPRLLVVAASAAAVVALIAAPAGADPAWASAQALPGLSQLNTTGSATVDDLSCSSAGNCGLIGTYSDSIRHVQGFVANEVNFVWGNAQPIPGLVDLNVNGSIAFPSISCPSATACSITGTYTDGQGNPYGFVDNETNGTWGTAQTLPLSSSLPTATQSVADVIKCTSPGTCVASGAYQDVNGGQAFVVSETSGTWSGAVEVPGTGQLNAGGFAIGTWMSCPQAGSCTLTGVYTDGGKNVQ